MQRRLDDLIRFYSTLDHLERLFYLATDGTLLAVPIDTTGQFDAAVGSLFHKSIDTHD